MSKVYIVMAGGATYEGNYEYLVKVYADKTAAELCALDLNELMNKIYETHKAENYDLLPNMYLEVKKLHFYYNAGDENTYSVDEHEVVGE
jgi:hypothetical protein